MRVILYGGTGMVGQGVLRECLADPRVTEVLAVGRTAVALAHPRLRQLVPADVADAPAYADELDGFDACFFCLGVSSVGLPAEEYQRITHDLTLAVGRVLAERSPGLTFCYVSGAGTDRTERGPRRWARVKGATENALVALPLRVYAFRPGYIQAGPGITSRTRWYALAYSVLAPLYPVLRRVAPGWTTRTDTIGRAMVTVAERGWPRDVMTSPDINAAGA
ncbi:epimerase [Pilimelia anulata]|uniref:Epimerase n=1 Tax=Pilimelia anulata TaxID=53371 RepID=A0A8J3F6B4_9ACTN|nr:NAD(P)H-binding protein [Pilimelia anulata]GGJ79266.1 epimerase [Pilimelia anulata]